MDIWLRQLLRETCIARERVEALMALATELEFPLWLGFAAIMRGWLLVEEGQVEQGIARMHDALGAYRATGAELGRSRTLTMLAAAHARIGQSAQGFALLAEALAIMQETGEGFEEAELYRIKGQMHLWSVEGRAPKARRHAADEDAEACFRLALDIARRRQGKSWELRAAMSLGRLWQRQGKTREARELLTSIHASFSEGFDTADLREARALLEEIG